MVGSRMRTVSKTWNYRTGGRYYLELGNFNHKNTIWRVFNMELISLICRSVLCKEDRVCVVRSTQHYKTTIRMMICTFFDDLK